MKFSLLFILHTYYELFYCAHLFVGVSCSGAISSFLLVGTLESLSQAVGDPEAHEALQLQLLPTSSLLIRAANPIECLDLRQRPAAPTIIL